MSVALVTDSGSQMPAALRRRFDVRVVPLTVVIDGEPFREGVDIATSEFYERLAQGATVSTAAPAPGEVLAVYEDAVDAGATEIVSVHIGSNTSGTLAAVQIAAEACPVPVDLVDTGTASFAVACCVWAAGDALGAGDDAETATEAARITASRVGNVFVVGALDLARRGGRLDPSVAGGEGVPVLALEQGRMHAVAHAGDEAAAIEAMVSYVVHRSEGLPLRVGVGDAVHPEMAGVFTARLTECPEVSEIMRYEIGPSVGAHTGPGTVGACFFAAPGAQRR